MKGYDDSTYGDSFADVYDDWYEDVSDINATVRTLQELAGNGPFHELGIGTGRLALALAQTGATVSGIDSSALMLERLSQKAADRGLEIEAIKGDMVDEMPVGPFAAIFVAYNTIFSVQTFARQQTLFANVASRLAPGGIFVVEAIVPDPQRPAGSTVGVRSMKADRVVLSVDMHDPEAQHVDGQFVEFTEAGGVRLRPWSIRYSYPHELDDMAATVGLRLSHRWVNMNQEPFTSDAETHVSVYTQSS